ncbi:hypothetical protein Glove_79g61 [Diversispora epigaea]|uniref:MI domain-containing protein n=1 Tax=Diversispora epigaea TaxID=1348612 RepID=A0A397JF68_9GLOM|nr:hypothetical protein Glove_79g61 [Diversispora epigaea]
MASLCVKDLPKEYHSKVVASFANKVLEKKQDDVRKVIEMFDRVINEGVLSKKEFIDGLAVTIEFLIGIGVDAPKSYTFTGQLLLTARFDLKEVMEILKPLLDDVKGTEKVDEQSIARKVKASGFDFNLILPHSDVNKFLESLLKFLRFIVNQVLYSLTNTPYEFQLILRRSINGFEPQTFWDTAMILRTVDNSDTFGNWGNTNDSFIFSLKNGNIQNSILSRVKKRKYAICNVLKRVQKLYEEENDNEAEAEVEDVVDQLKVEIFDWRWKIFVGNAKIVMNEDIFNRPTSMISVEKMKNDDDGNEMIKAHILYNMYQMLKKL